MDEKEKNIKQKESWDTRYASGKYSSAAPPQLLVSLLETLPRGKALDLACGAGRSALFLAEKGFRVTAVDNSSVGVEIAQRRAAEKSLEIDFRVADLEKGEFTIEENFYDLICDFYYLQRDLFEPMKRGVKAGGIIIAAIHIYGAGEEPGRFMLREGELTTIFEDFEILHFYETPLPGADTGEHHRRTAEIVAKAKGKS